jgi:copper chaperone
MGHCCGGESKKTITLGVKGMTCHHCEMSIKKAVGAIDGVSGVEVDIGEGKVKVQVSGHVDPDSIKNAITELGYDVES